MVEGATDQILMVQLAITFAASFFLTYITLDFIIFREINDLKMNLDRLSKDKKRLRHQNFSLKNTSEINSQINEFVARKEKEISTLKELANYRREFLADVSHELKTPIFAAQGYILTLLDGAIEDNKVRNRFLKKAAKSINRLDLLVQDLLLISQMESGQLTMVKENFDLLEVVKDIIEELENKAEKNNVQVLLRADKSKYMTYADPAKIRQVILNLLINGIKYNKQGGKVSVRLDNSMNMIEVEVKDTGIGISKEHLSRIYERFYRVDKSRSKKQGGTGLGLAIVKHIIDGHKSGGIHIQSKLGEGTTFLFSLPTARNESEAN
jgi:two-component system phosphate regulon sensor histidine kinase PhoR